MNKQFAIRVLLTFMGLILIACGHQRQSESENVKVNKISIEIAGYEWGPAVPKVILELNQKANEAVLDKVQVKTAGVNRKVQKVYLSDAKAKVAKGSSKYVTLELAVTYTFEAKDNASPFYYNLESLRNEWAKDYQVEVKDLRIDGQKLSAKADAIKNRVMNDTDLFNVRGDFSGKYTNPMTNQEEELQLTYAAYEPEKLKNSKAKSPLVIWLHGQGEGGEDVEISLLGNEVTALAKKDIQRQYTATSEETEKGTYVLVVQTPTYWMDEGDGRNGGGSGISRYTDILMDTIKDYVAGNPDIDSDRIYLGGCSNGGYMTLNMAIQYPDYFAAAYPIAEAYSYYELERNADGSYVRTSNEDSSSAVYIPTDERFLTEEKVDKLKDLPMWFILTANDNVVLPERYALPTYQALVQNSSNKWLSYFQSVTGSDIKGNSYLGHWSWIYFFNNQVEGVQNLESIRAATDTVSGYSADNVGQGGSSQASADGKTYATIFEWMNAQSK